MAVAVWWEAKGMDQTSKVLLSIWIIGILLFCNLTFLNKMASAETTTTNGLVLYYHFDDNHYNSSGHNVEDWSGNDNDGIIYNHSNYSGNTLFGRAMTFDGDDDYIYINESSSLALDADLTIDVWVYWQGIQCQAIVQNPSYFGLYIMADGTVGIGDGLGIDISETAVSVESCKWTYISFTRRMLTEDYAEMSIYIDGRLVCQCQDYVSYILYDYKPTYIGCHGDDQNTNRNKYFNGIIDELKIYEIVKTPADGMGRRVFDMAFEENNGNIAYDRSGMNIQGTVFGASWNPIGVYGSRCLDFNGINNYVNIESYDILDVRDFTIEAWVCWEGNNSNCDENTIISEFGHYWLYIDGSGKLCFKTCYPYPSSPIASEHSISVGEWTKISVSHIYSLYSTDNTKIFINGVLENVGGSGNYYYPYPVSSSIGCYNDVMCYFNGKIDNVQIFNSANEVGCEVERYQFENPGSSTVIDESPYGNNGGLHGGAQQISHYNAYPPIQYGSCLKLNCQQSPFIPYVNDDYAITSWSEIITNSNTLTIEARISYIPTEWEPYNYKETIIYNEGNFWLYLFDNHLWFKTYLYDDPHVVVSDSSIPILQWTNIAVSVTDISSEWRYVRMYIDGELDATGLVSAPDRVICYSFLGCIGAEAGDRHWYCGFMDDVVISTHAKTFHEDTDGDGMSDQYEMVRSVDSMEYNYLEYNGRCAILCAPVRANNETQFKYDITQMRYYLIANGWSDCDIIFLTCKDNTGRENLSEVVAEFYNGDWIDGEAYHDNLGNAFNVLEAGGSFTLKQSDGDDEPFSFAQTSSRDIVFIELRDHGIAVQGNTHNFCTYIPTNYSTVPPSNEIGNDSAPILASYWSAGNIDSELDNITAKYIIIDLDYCFAGGWVNSGSTNFNGSINGNNRIILMSQNNMDSKRNAYLLYSRIWGDISANFVDENGTTWNEKDWNNTEYRNRWWDNHSIYSGNNFTQNADDIINCSETIWTQSGMTYYLRTPNRGQTENGIISVQEAHYFSSCVCSHRFEYDFTNTYTGVHYYPQRPQISIGDNIISSIYL